MPRKGITSRSSGDDDIGGNENKSRSGNDGKNFQFIGIIPGLIILVIYSFASDELFSSWLGPLFESMSTKSSSYQSKYVSNMKTMNSNTTRSKNNATAASTSAAAPTMSSSLMMMQQQQQQHNIIQLNTTAPSLDATDTAPTESSSSMMMMQEQQQQQQTHQKQQTTIRLNITENNTLYVETGQLVVDVDQTYMLWGYGHSKYLCPLLENLSEIIRNNSTVSSLIKQVEGNNVADESSSSLSSSSIQQLLPLSYSYTSLPPPMIMSNETKDATVTLVPSSVTINVTADCKKIVGGLGEGNWVSAIYAARLTTYLYGMNFKFQCIDQTIDAKSKKLLPWFDQFEPAYSNNNMYNVPGYGNDDMVWPFGGPWNTVPPKSKSYYCPSRYNSLRLNYVTKMIQDDLQRMAVTIVGTINDGIRHHRDVPIDAKPFYNDGQEIELDDVAIHWRCGDVMGGANRYDFGMIGFNEYKKWIPNTTKTIGIITQPFDPTVLRGQDRRKASACKVVAHALKQFLHDEVVGPNAKITFRNDGNETVPLAYARLVMANISITSLSSFGIFPVIGTFGEGYFQKGNRGINPFASLLPETSTNLHVMNAKVNPTGRMRGKTTDQLIEWFTNN